MVGVKTLSEQALAALGIGIAHHFGGGVYVKETEIPAGATLGQHAHGHDHLSYLVKGKVIVSVDGVPQVLHAPSCIKIEAGKTHDVAAVTEALWLCIWATDCEDPTLVDEVVGA